MSTLKVSSRPKSSLKAVLRRAFRRKQRKPAIRYAASRVASRARSGRLVAKKKKKVRVNYDRAGAISMYSEYHKPKTLIAKINQKLQDSSYIYSQGRVLTSTAGNQAYDDVYNVFDPADCDIMRNLIQDQAYNAAGGILPYGFRTTNMMFKSAIGEIMFTNTTDVTTKVILYAIKARRDLTTDTTGQLAAPSVVWNYGTSYQNTNGAGTAYIVGSMPTDSHEFNRFYRIVKAYHCELAPGQTWFHRFKYCPERMLSREVFTNANGGIHDIKGFNLRWMVQAYGCPVADGPGTGTTTAPVHLHYVTKCTFRFSAVLENMSLQTYDSRFSLATTANTQLLNLVTGGLTAFTQV